MKKKNWSDRLILCLFVLLSLRCQGQDSFHYRVRLDTPRETDFYKILLSPEVVAQSKEYLADLRILGTDGHFVPYVLKDAVDTGGPVYQPLPTPSIVQKDSTDHHSYFTLQWPESYRIHRLSLTIKYPALFKREARILAEAPDGSWSQVLLASIDPRDTVLRIPGVMTAKLRIDVVNADNSPLKIVGVSADQSGIYLLTYLQGGSYYELLTGNAKADAPQYDLRYFTDSLTRRPREIKAGAGQQMLVVAGEPSASPATSTYRSGGRAGFLLWSVLSTVLLLLIYFSVKMVSAIGAKKAPHDRI